MLYPIRNKFRSFIELGDFWDFRIDKENAGIKEEWFKGFETDLEIAVPGSWNEQLEEAGLLNYTGFAWYHKRVFIPHEGNKKRIFIRIGSADFSSLLWINGKFAGENNFGFLPFEFDITDFIVPGEDTDITLAVSNELNDDSIPQGIEAEYYRNENRLREETFPAARFDFSPYGGINRPVIIYSVPQNFISGVKINSSVTGTNKGRADVSVEITGNAACSVEVECSGKTVKAVKVSAGSGNIYNASVVIDDCRLWSPEDPYLYDFKIKLFNGNETVDEYVIPFGIREVKIIGNKLLLNGKEIYLKGFGKHEDYSIIGKGLFLPLITKDFELFKWINANSFRTSHYPYADEIMSYADRKGILIIDEVPAVSLDFRYINGNTRANHKEFIKRLIERDYNHPSVIIWSAGNEPNIVGEPSYYDGRGREYWKDVIGYLRSIDNSRPVTVPNCTRAGVDDPVFEFCDVISLNRYYGWYEYPGRIENAVEILGNEMDLIYSKYKKPIFFTEFGVDTVAGLHSTSDQMFTEEYQAKYLEEYINLFRKKDYMIGEHVWNFADFRTPQHFRRVVMNLKGVFSRERMPKFAAFKLKEIWGKSDLFGKIIK